MSTQNETTSSENRRKIRVMLVDDSVVIRGFISRMLQTQDNIEVVSSVQNGQLAVQSVVRADPDIVILDIEMPVMDGITALPQILKARPGTKVVMCSTLTTRNADITLQAMKLGAVDCIAKPTSSLEVRNKEDFQTTLMNIVNGIGGSAARARGASLIKPSTSTYISPAAPASKTSPTLRAKSLSDNRDISVIAIGSSTGGPNALFTVLKQMKNLRVPIVITQHMPPTFTMILAQHIEQQTGIPSHEGAEGMLVEAGHAYVAPGGKHMEFEKDGTRTKIRLSDNPPENFCKPSVDPMMRSAIKIYGARNVFGIILTGMGHDGLHSCMDLVKEGGRIIAQDEKTSVVWGMPGAVSNAGICTDVLPVDQIAGWVRGNLNV